MTSRFRGGEIYGIPIRTVFDENDTIRCAGCGEPISGTPFRVTLLDIVAPEAPPSWALGAKLNPGPHQFHAQPEHFRAWLRKRGYLFCRLSDVREIMRPGIDPRRFAALGSLRWPAPRGTRVHSRVTDREAGYGS